MPAREHFRSQPPFPIETLMNPLAYSTTGISRHAAGRWNETPEIMLERPGSDLALSHRQGATNPECAQAGAKGKV